VAVILARPNFKQAESQYKELNARVSTGAQTEVQAIIDELTTSTGKPDKQAEIERVRKVASTGTIRRVKKPRVDVFLDRLPKVISEWRFFWAPTKKYG